MLQNNITDYWIGYPVSIIFTIILLTAFFLELILLPYNDNV